MIKGVRVRDLGRKDYKPCWDLQEEIFQGMVKAKIARRNAGLSTTELGRRATSIWRCPSRRCCGWSIRTS